MRPLSDLAAVVLLMAGALLSRTAIAVVLLAISLSLLVVVNVLQQRLAAKAH